MILGLTGGHGGRNSQLSRSSIALKLPIKSKLFNLLTVCLATSGLLAPAQAAFGNSTEGQIKLEQAQHLVCVKQGEHLLCDVEKSSEPDQESRRQLATVNERQATDTLKSSTVTVVPQLLSPAEQGSIANLLIWIGYLLPCGLALGIFLYDKYSAYRSAILHEQIERLERLWKQSTQP
jgi:hypothetical protein